MKKDIIYALKFGLFGREDGCLVIVYKNKGFDVKILARNFNFSVLLYIYYKIKINQYYYKSII